MRRVFIVILDGLRRDFIRPETTPNLFALKRSATFFADHRSVFPSVTRVVSASFATGCHPARHELQGNTVALVEKGRLVEHDAGEPDFLQHKRRLTGRALGMPTLADRVREAGGSRIFGNVSPGATYAHDPDGSGFVFNRAGSYGPGRTLLPPEQQFAAMSDLAGDRVIIDRFLAELSGGPPTALAQIWMSEPDVTQHAEPLGSPAHIDMLRRADAHAGMVIDAVHRLAGRGDDDVLLIVGSDHGHQTVGEIVDIDHALVEAGLKDRMDSDDVMAISSGTAALVYVDPERVADRSQAIGDFLRSRPWADAVWSQDSMAEIGLAPLHGLAFAVAMHADDEATNAFGVPGVSVLARPADGKAQMVGLGYHGGFGRFEQSPFLMIEGPGFAPGAVCAGRSSILDIAPTVLAHLRLPLDGMDGSPLQDRGQAPGAPRAGLAAIAGE